MMSSLSFKVFHMKLLINLGHLLKFYTLIMPENICLSNLSFLALQGILHPNSCAQPQQIGVVERKKHHLVETTCTLIIACYLINCMPLSILNNQTMYFFFVPTTEPLFYSSLCLQLYLFCP